MRECGQSGDVYKRQRKNSSNWWVELTAPDGKRIQQSAGTEVRELAQEYHDRLKAQFWDQKRLGIKARKTWQEAVVRYLSEKSHKSSLVSDKSHLRWLDKFLGKKMCIRDRYRHGQYG